MEDGKGDAVRFGDRVGADVDEIFEQIDHVHESNASVGRRVAYRDREEPILLEELRILWNKKIICADFNLS